MRLFLFLAVCACATAAAAKKRALPYSLRSDTGVTHHDRVWAMKLAPNADPRLIARRLHLVYVKPIFEGAYHIFREPSEEGRDGVRRIGQEQVARGAERDHDVVWFEKQTFRTQQKRTEVTTRTASVPGNLSSAGFLMSPQTESMLNSRYSRAVVERMKSRMIEEIARAPSNDPARGPNPMTVLDPQFPNQWHLRAAHPVGVKADYVWNMHESFRGQQSHIAIVDDGIHALLPDLRSQVDLEISGTFSASGNGQVETSNAEQDILPDNGDTHGTSCAGVAAAASNTVCGVGVCPNCTLSAVKLLSGPTTDFVESQALSFYSHMINVYSNSWGPVDNGRTMVAPGQLTSTAIAYNARNGRSGKGNLYVWAGGNGGQNGDNGNYDGYANHKDTIAVGAVGSDGKQAYYSESCACLSLSAPSSSGTGQGITTCSFDTHSNPTCITTFGGTSAAAPQVAGAIGLVLGKYPHLTRRDVTQMLAQSATQVDPSDPDWTPRNENGISHNHKYGWGLLNVAELVRYAILWQSVPAELSCSTRVNNVGGVVLQDGQSAWSWPVDMTAACAGTPGAAINYIEYVTLTVKIQAAHRGDVAITVRDPLFVKSVMALGHSDSSAFPSEGWTYGSARHMGQPMTGSWSVTIGDVKNNGRRVTVQSVQMTIYGHVKVLGGN